MDRSRVVTVNVINSEKTSINELVVDDIFWGHKKLGFGGVLDKIIPKQSIVILSYGNYDERKINNGLTDFFNSTDREVKIIGDNGDIITSSLTGSYYDGLDIILGPVAGCFISIDPDLLSNNVEYTLEFRNSSNYKFILKSRLFFVKDE